MNRAGPEPFSEPGSSLSLKHLAGTGLPFGWVSFSAVLLNMSSWGTGNISILWPSTGLLIGILLCLPRKQWLLYIAIGFVINLLANSLISQLQPFRITLYLTGCDMLEVFLASWLLFPTASPQGDLSRSGQILRLLGYGAILAPSVTSLIAACCLSGSFGKPTLHAFAQWFTGDALGNSIVIPLFLGLQKKAPFSKRLWFEVVFLFGQLCAVSFLVFWQTSLPLLFVILPFLLLVEVRLGLAGSAIGLLAVSVFGGYFTARNHGPVALALSHSASLSSRTLTLQFFIFVCMIVLYIVDVALAERNRFELSLRASELRFRLLAEGSRDIIMLQNLKRNREYVPSAAHSLLGWTPEEFLSLGRSEIIHPDDLASLTATYEQCRNSKATNTLDYRCKKKDGGYLWVQGNVVLHCAPETGAPVGFINVLRDISSRKAAEEELNKALHVAESRASIDALTGLANRRSFDEYFGSEWFRAIRARTPTSILMIDVDRFKPYNDRYGHVTGDHCLKQVAGAIASCIHRTCDLVARYGGEEFAVVLPNTDATGAQLIAEQIRKAVEQERIPHEGNPHLVVTISIGAAGEIPELGSICTRLIEFADKALYEAKTSGRNCVKSACNDIAQIECPHP